MVTLATPILAVREVLEQIAPELREGAVVTDTASTKERVLGWAAELLPQHVSFVGGHPMAGKETPGIENAEAELFRGRAYCLCPAGDAHEDAVRALVGLVRLIGAEPLFLDPREHDQYAGAVSHLPLVVSTALFSLMRASPAWRDLAPMASSGFRDVPPLPSREAAIHWLERMIEELRRYRDLLEEGDAEELLETFARAQMDRDTFIAQPPVTRLEEEKPDVRQELVNSLMGGWISDRPRKARAVPGGLK